MTSGGGRGPGQAVRHHRPDARHRFADVLGGLRLAVTLLSVVRVKGTVRTDRGVAGWAMALAPLIGLGLGLASALAMYASRNLLDPLYNSFVPALVGLSALALLTRGLHLDGLADYADGLGAGPDRVRALAAMRDSGVGAFGVATLFFVLLTEVVTLAQAVALHHGTVSLVLSAVTGRAAATLACTAGVPAAREGGLGATVAGSVPRRRAALVVLAVLALAVVAGRLDFDGGAFTESARAVVAVLVGLVVGALVLRRGVRRFGGITGDVLGAVVELTSLAVLIAMSTRAPSALLPWR